jgi:hypothetical protein
LQNYLIHRFDCIKRRNLQEKYIIVSMMLSNTRHGAMFINFTVQLKTLLGLVTIFKLNLDQDNLNMLT